jgi:hypothetical protein
VLCSDFSFNVLWIQCHFKPEVIDEANSAYFVAFAGFEQTVAKFLHAFLDIYYDWPYSRADFASK